MEGILGAKGPLEARRWLVKWSGYEEVTWEACSRHLPPPSAPGHAPCTCTSPLHVSCTRHMQMHLNTSMRLDLPR